MDGRDFVFFAGKNREPHDSCGRILRSGLSPANSSGRKLQWDAMKLPIGADPAEDEVDIEKDQALGESYGLRKVTSPEACPAEIGSLESFSGCVRSSPSSNRRAISSGSLGRPSSAAGFAGIASPRRSGGRQVMKITVEVRLDPLSNVEQTTLKFVECGVSLDFSSSLSLGFGLARRREWLGGWGFCREGSCWQCGGNAGVWGPSSPLYVRERVGRWGLEYGCIN